jgi:hypothetical protein
MFVCVYSVCVVLCVGSGLETGGSSSKESYRLCIGLGKLKRRPRPNERAVEPKKGGNIVEISLSQTNMCMLHFSWF